MQALCRSLLAATLLFAPCIALNSAANLVSVDPGSSDPSASHIPLHVNRASPYDLELGGDLTGLPPGATRYVTRDELLTLPQESYTVTGDPNFAGPTQISGVPLELLFRFLGAAQDSDLIVAASSDQYHAHYPRAYMEAHHPILVLTINGKPPSGWPKNPKDHVSDMGSYLISHPSFTPSFRVLSHDDEAQIPWGVVRIEFRSGIAIFGSIAPRGLNASDPGVQSGYRIAQQNCFRCHNMGPNGGLKAGRPWPVLSALAIASPDYFTAYVLDPQSRNSHAEMPNNPGYDGATLRALADYFRTFSSESLEKKECKP
jgi:mono/diheme cytochrome c family protein